MDKNLQKTEEKLSKFVVPKKIYKEKESSAVLKLLKERKITTIMAVSQILGIRYRILKRT